MFRAHRLVVAICASLAIGIVAAPANGAGVVSAKLWHVPEALAQSAVPANVPTRAPDVTFNVNSPLNFDTSLATVGQWLANGGAFNVVEATPGTLPTPMDNFVVGTIVEFQGFVTVTNGQTFTVRHDDGVTLIINGLNLGFLAGPTPPLTEHKIYTGPSGTFPFRLVYAACCSGFAVLQVNLPVTNSTAEAVLLQAVPNGANTFVAARVSGGTPNSQSTVEFLASESCTDGTLGTDAHVFASVPGALDQNGQLFLVGPVNGVVEPDETYAAARVVGSSSAPSPCIVAGPDNDSWVRALLLDQTDSVEGFIDASGRARWYRFPIPPGAQATITLFGLPADYDIAVFKDISQAFGELVGNTDVAGLNRLSAEFAPSVFSPSVFSPSVFSASEVAANAYAPSVFSPSVFSPSVFSSSLFAPSVFSPSVFSPSVFSSSEAAPSVFSPSVFSQAGFNPSVFSPSVFSADNFANAQIRSLIAVSAAPGTTTERVLADTWNNTGYFYVRVAGKNGVADIEQPFQLSVSVDGALCDGVEPLASPTPITASIGPYTSVILWDSIQLAAAGNTPADITLLQQKLDALAGRPEVAGVVVDLGGIPDIQDLHEQADNHTSCPYAENLTAHRIKDVVDAYRAKNPELAYVVIAGSDGQVPFFRYPDQGLLGPEMDYDPPMAEFTQAQSALRLNYVLGQDEYGANTSLSLRDGDLPVPNLAVGRLVETVPEMVTMLDAYLATANGTVPTPTSTLVTGYDFLADVAGAVQSELAAATSGSGPVARNETLITAANISPADPLSWTATNLRSALLNQGEDVVFLAGHFSANNALAADYTTTMLVTELAASNVDLRNALVFSAGCHSGYNIVNGEVVPGVTLPLDWAQAFAQKGATLVAGTGYQYGDTDFIEYSERLYLEFAKQLRTGIGPVAVGQALVRAKQRYLETTPDVRGLHRKSVLISSVFGLPMLKVNMRGTRITNGSAVALDPDPVSCAVGLPTCPASALGLESEDLTLQFPNPSGALTEIPVALTNLDGGALTAHYLRGPDGVVTNPGEPALPLKSVNVGATGLSLRGVALIGGGWNESLKIPLTGAPTTELRGVHTPFTSLVNFPMRLATPNYYGAVDTDGPTILHVTPVQNRVDNIGDVLAHRRQFDDLTFRLFYSSNTLTYGATQTYAGNRPALSGPPTMSNVRAAKVGTDIVFDVNVVGDPAAGIQAVWVTYTEGAAASGRWVSLQLDQDPQDSTHWTKTLAGNSFTRLDYFVQAVNGVGLVNVDDNYGAYYRVFSSGTPAPLIDTSIALASPLPPPSAAYGSEVPVTAHLTTTSNVPIANAYVLFSLGGASRSAKTDGSGFASVAALPVNVTPDDYLLTASFAGNDTYAPSTAETQFDVTKVGTALTFLLKPQTVGVDSVQSGVSVKLTDAFGTPLPQKTVYFSIPGGPDGLITVPAITDINGVAPLGALVLPPQLYTVTAQYLGQITTATTTLNLTNTTYGASTATTALNLAGGTKCPKAPVNGSLLIGGFCYLKYSVTGSVIITNGTLIVGGSSVIGGGIGQIGAGNVVIRQGTSVRGSVVESLAGDVVVHGSVRGLIAETGTGGIELGPTSSVQNAVTELDDGAIVVGGRVTGFVTELGAGDLTVQPGAIVTGHVTETANGSLVVLGQINGNAFEFGAGDLTVGVGGLVTGSAGEADNGSLVVSGRINGNASEFGAGNLIIQAGGSVGGTVKQN